MSRIDFHPNTRLLHAVPARGLVKKSDKYLKRSKWESVPFEVLENIITYFDSPESFRIFTLLSLSFLSLRHKSARSVVITPFMYFPTPFFFKPHLELSKKMSSDTSMVTSGFQFDRDLASYFMAVLKNYYVIAGPSQESLHLISRQTGLTERYIPYEKERAQGGMLQGTWQKVCVSAELSYVVTLYDDGNVDIWNSEMTKRLRRFSFGYVAGFGMTPDASRLIVLTRISPQYFIDTYELNRTDRISRQAIALSSRPEFFSVSSDAQFAIFVFRDNSVALWSLEKSAWISQFLGHTDVVTHAKLTADSRYLVTASKDNSIRIWDVETSVCQHILQTAWSGINDIAIALSPDQKPLLFVVANKHIVGDFYNHETKLRDRNAYEVAKQSPEKLAVYCNSIRNNLGAPVYYVFDIKSGVCLLRQNIVKDRALAVLAGKDDAALLECVWALNFDVKKALFHTPCRIAIQDDLVLFGYPDGSLMQRKKHVLIYDSLATIQDVESDKFCSVM